MPYKRLLFLDLETYYDKVFSLREMPTPNYILDPRFEVHMCAVKDGPDPTKRSTIVDGPDFAQYLSSFDPNETATVTFNALFDNSVLAWRYGFVPHTMIDAMGMARALLGHQLTSFSLASVAKFLGLGAKGGALIKTLGLHRQDIINQGLWTEFCDYAIQDNDLNEGIFLRLLPQFPPSEQRLMDLVLRTTIEPRFEADIQMLTDHLADVRATKAALINAAGVDKTALMSAAKFKLALEALGVEVEMKVSPTTGKENPCFARTDKFMEDLADHPDVRVQALVAARLGTKSTLEETRTEKLLSIAKLPWTVNPNGVPRIGWWQGHTGNMPMPLRYGAAHTHRLGGDWGMNVQNLPTLRGSKGKSKLRLSLKAPMEPAP